MFAQRLTQAVTRCRRLSAQRAMASTGAGRRSCEGIVVCADFDQTITKRDTIALLFDAANAKRADTSERAAHTRQVERLVGQYTDEATALSVSALTRNAPASRFDANGLEAFLNAFAEVDLRSIQRVIESKTLQGLARCDLEAIADKVDVMEKSVDVLRTVPRAVVTSSNWSQTMIREKLRRSDLVSVQVIANELRTTDDGITTGDIDLVVQSPSDKANIVAQEKARGGSLVVFIGDSTNDLLAMLHADVGITLGFGVESTFVRVCRQFGIGLIPLSKFKDLLACETLAAEMVAANHRVLFTASSWAEIHDTLSTCDSSSP